MKRLQGLRFQLLLVLFVLVVVTLGLVAALAAGAREFAAEFRVKPKSLVR